MDIYPDETNFIKNQAKISNKCLTPVVVGKNKTDKKVPRLTNYRIAQFMQIHMYEQSVAKPAQRFGGVKMFDVRHASVLLFGMPLLKEQND